jgi:hypothetical protein
MRSATRTRTCGGGEEQEGKGSQIFSQPHDSVILLVTTTTVMINGLDSAGGGPGGGGAAVGAERMSIKRKSRNKLPMEEKRVTSTEMAMVVCQDTVSRRYSHESELLLVLLVSSW